MNRRNLLQLLGATGIQGASAPLRALGQGAPFALLHRPQDFGARADGTTLDSGAVNAAIDRASGQGGGVLYLSPGVYLCGTIILKTNVTLYIEAGATILGSKDVAQYTPQPGPPENADANTRHLLFAKDAENITICGPGLIDGQGPSFWIPSARRHYGEDELWADVASLYLNPKPRVSPMLEFVNCRHVHVEGLRIENASGWTMRLMSCVGVVVDGISIKNPVVGPNTDGIDISNSSDVRIANCSIDTGDDAICLKSENPYGDTVPVMRNVTVTNCTLTSCCNGFKFGTRTYSGCENIVFSNSTIHNRADSRLNARVIAGVCLEMVDGGWLENVVVSGICMQRTRTPIFLRLGSRTPARAGVESRMRGIMISDVYATEAQLTSSITGVPNLPIEDVTLSNLDIETREPGRREQIDRKIPEAIRDYPEARMFGRLPAYGLYVRHGAGVQVKNAKFRTLETEQRPAMVCEDVVSLEVAGLRVPVVGSKAPVVDLRDTSEAWIRDGRAPAGAESLVHISGSRSKRIVVTGCDVLDAGSVVSLGPGTEAGAVTLANNVPPREAQPDAKNQ